MRVVIAGGGAAGCFAALACAETASGLEVVVLEKSPEPLAKVAISGGGRCNVTHDGDDPRALAEFYPRGRRELVGPLTRWGPRDTVRWFEARGVPIKAEPDGRMFPASDSSASITGALLRALEQAGVRLRTRAGLRAARRTGAGFRLELTDGGTLDADRLVLATGGNAASGGFEIAAALGHTILPPVPSLFTFHVDDARLRGLQGLSAPDAVARAPVFRLRQRGPVLI